MGFSFRFYEFFVFVVKLTGRLSSHAKTFSNVFPFPPGVEPQVMDRVKTADLFGPPLLRFSCS
jgi:hypothetical protein